jgi:two-component system response regulator FixJ
MEHVNQKVSLIGKRSEDITALAAMLRGQAFSVGEYETAEEFLVSHDRVSGGCIVIMTGPNEVGLEVQKRLCDEAIELPIVVVCESNDVRTAVEAMKNGAFTVVELSSPVRNLIEALVDTLRQDSEMRSARQHRSEIVRRLRTLNERERQTAELLLAGASNKLIANRLDAALRTVEFHRSMILKKLGVKTIAEFVQIVMLANDRKTVAGGTTFPKMLHSFETSAVSSATQNV